MYVCRNSTYIHYDKISYDKRFLLPQVQLALEQNAEAVKNATEACAIMRKVRSSGFLY
jgi:hypothetical protein